MYRPRFYFTLFLCFIGKSRGLLDLYRLRFWALPFFDTDLTRLFTQTYGVYMGIGRWHYVFSSVFKVVALKNFWAPVTTRETIAYKRGIKAFERVELQTQLLCWDERRFYLSQKFFVHGEERASALVEGLLRGPKGHLNPIEVFGILGVKQASPAFPQEVKGWIGK